MQDERSGSSDDDDSTVRWSVEDGESGTVLRPDTKPPPSRRLKTQSEITSALDAPPIDDLTRPEVHVPMDVPPDDLTEAHEVYLGDDGDGASLPHEAPFGAHVSVTERAPDVEGWTTSQPPPPPSSSADATAPRSSVTRVRTRTIAVEEDLSSNFSLPPSRPPEAPASRPLAAASTPPTVMVSPSIAPPVGDAWAQHEATWRASQAPSQPPVGPLSRPGFGTVEMNLQVSNGVPMPMPPRPPQRVAPAPSAPKPDGVRAGIWVAVAIALVACVAMIAYARLRG